MALPMAVLVVSVVFVLATMALRAATTELRLQRERTDGNGAFYLAEAARHLATSALARSGAWPHDGVEFPLGDGSYAVTVTTPDAAAHPNRRRITARGYVPSRDHPRAARTVVQEVDVLAGGGNEAFRYATIADRGVRADGRASLVIQGPTYGRDYVASSRNAYIEVRGDASLSWTAAFARRLR